MSFHSKALFCWDICKQYLPITLINKKIVRTPIHKEITDNLIKTRISHQIWSGRRRKDNTYTNTPVKLFLLRIIDAGIFMLVTVSGRKKVNPIFPSRALFRFSEISLILFNYQLFLFGIGVLQNFISLIFH